MERLTGFVQTTPKGDNLNNKTQGQQERDALSSWDQMAPFS